MQGDASRRGFWGWLCWVFTSSHAFLLAQVAGGSRDESSGPRLMPFLLIKMINKSRESCGGLEIPQRGGSGVGFGWGNSALGVGCCFAVALVGCWGTLWRGG